MSTEFTDLKDMVSLERRFSGVLKPDWNGLRSGW